MAALSLGLTGCAQQPSGATDRADLLPHDGVTDLVAEFSTAEIAREVHVLDFGSEDSRSQLVEGWGHIEEWGRGTHGAWAMGRHSSVRLYVGTPRPIDLIMRCWALSQDDAGRQSMTVFVNGRRIDDVVVSPQPGAERIVSVPASYLVSGSNLVDFQYEVSTRPKEVNPESGDGRPLSVFWDTLEIRGLHEARSPEVKTQAQPPEIVIPVDSRVTFYQLLGPETDLMLQGMRMTGIGGRDWILQVQVDTDGAWSRRFDIPVNSDRGVQSIPLGLPSTQPTRISFQPTSPHRNPRHKGALHLVRPVLKVAPPIPSVPMSPPADGASEASAAMAHVTRPNIIIYLIDCLRADHVGTYGYDRPVTPNIDGLARDSVLFSRFIAQSSWTRPAVASLLSGLYPQEHGVQSDRDMLPQGVPFLPQILRNLGYHTAAVITNGMVSQEFGFGRGFDFFERLPEQHKKTPEIHQLSDRINQVVFDWLDQRPQAEPFFMYIHSTDPHAPYLPRSPYREKFAAGVTDPGIGRHDRIESLNTASPEAALAVKNQLKELYDGEIAFNDANFGDLVGLLKEKSLYQDALIIVTADHGEEFYDHGRWQHGFALYQESIHVPMIIKFPKRQWAGKTVKQIVGQVDVLPTLLDYLETRPPGTVSGHSVMPWIASKVDLLGSVETFASLARDPSQRDVRTLIFGNWKLIRHKTYDRPRATLELYNLSVDSGEEENLALHHPIMAGFLSARLAKFMASRQTIEAEEAEIDPETEENLKALGYLK